MLTSEVGTGFHVKFITGPNEGEESTQNATVTNSANSLDTKGEVRGFSVTLFK
jgi:hypothetical protein